MTSLGINNYGKLAFRYGLEDTDVDENGEEVFREMDSVFFNRIRTNFVSELKALYATLESSNAWHAESTINQFDEWQAQFPEELWRIDCQRKYIRTYNSSFIDGKGDAQFLTNMAMGRKKYQRRQYERNQEKYMASKYQSSVASGDNAVIRATAPEGTLAVPKNYRLKLTPYSYLYLNVKYGTQAPIQMRVEPNKEYEIPFTGDSADIIDIWSCSQLTSLGNLSSTYPATVDTSKASKLKELNIGSDVEGYKNDSFTTLTLGANYLLEKLNVENVTGLTQSLNLSALSSLKELYAKGTNSAGVTFADGGLIEIAELPEINAMSMKNLLYLTTLDVVSFKKLTTLTVENCNTVDLLSILNSAPNLNRVRITGIDWNLEDIDLLERIYAMKGLDKSGYNIDRSVLSGKVYVPVIREQQLKNYQTAWNDLDISYGALINQFTVTFVNADDNETVLDVQYVDKGDNAVDPIARTDNPIPTPTLESTVSTNFTFDAWDGSLENVFADRVIKATYSESVRDYAVKYVSKGTVLQTTTAPYGSMVVYKGDTPVYTAEESAYKYNLFSHWDNSGLVDGDKTINAVFESCEYVEGYFAGKELSEMSKVEIYALMKLGKEQDVLSIKDSINFEIGNDFHADDIEEVVVIDKPTVFDGTNHLDTGVSFMEMDGSWTLACDFAFASGNTTGATLMQCMRNNGMDGFKLWNSSGAKLSWGTASLTPASGTNREMLVMRHEAGSPTITVYISNISGSDISVQTLTAIRNPVHEYPLVFGAARADDGEIENYCKGTVYWCKLWYADLGDAVCADISQWTHEVIPMELAKFRANYLADEPTKRSRMTFMAANLMSINSAFASANSNAGGWANSVLNTKLNTRLVKAISPLWKALIKPVVVASSVGGKSVEVSNSNCYFYIPAVYDVDNSKNTEPYMYETNGCVSYMTNDAMRKRAKVETPDVYNDYWTRSPSISSSNYVYYVDSTGMVTSYKTPTTELGILLMFSFGV